MNKRLGALLIALPLCAAAALPYTFQSGQTISAAEINGNFAYLNSRIDALTTSTAPVLISKAGPAPVDTDPPAVVIANTGSIPLEVLEQVETAGNLSWYYTCGATMLVAGVSPRYVGPGCTVGVRQSGGMQINGSGYIVTYRQ